MYPYPTVFYSKSELFKGYGKDIGLDEKVGNLYHLWNCIVFLCSI